MTTEESARLVRYGKPSEDLLRHKVSFFEQNDMHREETLRVFNLYAQQPRRVRCKCCDEFLGDVSFTKLGIDYILCTTCGHLNGAHEDTVEFCQAVYADDGGGHRVNYDAKSDADYRNRTHDIYVPKAMFLADALAACGEVHNEMSYADLGAGSGHFVSALQRCGMGKVRGFETSAAQVDLGNRMNGGDKLERCGLNDITQIAASIDAQVLSLVHVLEHLRAPRELLSCLKKNKSVKYLFLAVPLFSPSVFFEMIFPTVFHRNLACGHTHLYTDSSLEWLCREFGFSRVAEWWFGTDVVDWYRNVMVRARQQQETAKMADLWAELWAPAIDDLQLELDRRRMSSEVHLLLRIER
jgi:2-polyprenyl-3-methyl-5-hydroxy-6-metoxy-1,4-benzoquinol methylase